jgi:hypothetical protein
MYCQWAGKQARSCSQTPFRWEMKKLDKPNSFIEILSTNRTGFFAIPFGFAVLRFDGSSSPGGVYFQDDMPGYFFGFFVSLSQRLLTA